MALTSKQAKEVVSIVASDLICRARITGPALGAFSRFVSAQGWAGPIRNSALLFGEWVEASDPLFQRVCCIGIAEAAVDALLDEHHKPRPSFVSKVNQAIRSPGGSFHEAPAIWTKDGSHYVFDWWKTLDPDNPFIYRYGDWLLNKNPTQFVNFRGY